MNRNIVGTGFLLFLCLLISGCSGSGKSSNPGPQTPGPSGLQFTSPASSPTIDAGQSVALIVNQPVTWSLQGGLGKPVGSLSQETATGATYTAPEAGQLTSSTVITVVATLVSDSTQSAALGVIVNPVVRIGGSFSGGNTSCQYDPISGIGRSAGNAGIAFGAGNLITYLSAIGGTAPYTWSLASGSLPTGLSLASAVNGFGVSQAYLSGTPVSAGCSPVTIEVTDANGASAITKTNYVIIVPPNLKIQVPNYPDSYGTTPYPPTTFTVSGGVAPYLNWSISSPSSNPLPPGMNLMPDANNSAAAIVSGTPSGNNGCLVGFCQGYNPQVQVEDSQLPYPAYGLVTLNVGQWAALAPNACSEAGGSLPGAVANLQGSYAFLLRGFDAEGPVVIAGSFAADGKGNVTGGVEDVMRTTGSETQATISSGSYFLPLQLTTNTTFEQAGCLMMTTSAGTTTFALSMGGCSTGANPLTGACMVNAQGAPGTFTTGRLIEFDDNTGSGTRASGIVRLQDNSAFSAGLNGLYAFGLSGWDSAGGRYAVAGSFSASSANLSSVAADINGGGVLQSALTGGTGTLGAIDGSTGRGTASLSVGSSSFNNLSVYVVSAKEALVTNTGTPGASNPVFGGEAISATGPFSSASLQNTHIFHVAGLSSAGPDANIGILQFDGAGDFTGTQYEDQAGTLGTTSLSGAYTVDSSTGRFAVSAPSPGQNIGDHPLVGYVIPVASTLTRQNCVQLASCVTGFLLSTDATAQAGQLEFQTPSLAPPPPFSTLYFTGYYFYGIEESLDASTPLFAGASFANPTGAKYAGIQSGSYPNSTYCMQPGCVLLLPNEALDASASYSVSSNGAATIGGETVAVTNGNVTFYIDESPTNAHPSIMVIEQ